MISASFSVPLMPQPRSGYERGKVKGNATTGVKIQRSAADPVMLLRKNISALFCIVGNCENHNGTRISLLCPSG